MKILATAMCLVLVLAPIPALATEGALGRSITGLQAISYSGLIPPTPGWSLAFGYAHYSGEMEASRPTPIGGEATLGLKATLDMETATAVYIWDTGEGRWNFASMVTVPLLQVDANANVGIGQLQGEITDSSSGLFDAFFAPVIASYHIDPMRHVSVSLYIYAPSGDYQAGRLANTGLNVWTFSPTVGYTQLFGDGSLEWSSTAAVDFYSRNDATDYQNGAVFRLDTLLVKRFSNGWGIGAVGGWIQQLEDDEGALAESLDGFRGHAFGLGPSINYLHKWESGQVEFSARWLTEFSVKNRLEGSPFLISAGVQF